MILSPRGHWSTSGDIFDSHNQGVLTGILEVRTRLNILQHMEHPSTTNNFLAQSINSTEFKKPYSGIKHVQLILF